MFGVLSVKIIPSCGHVVDLRYKVLVSGNHPPWDQYRMSHRPWGVRTGSNREYSGTDIQETVKVRKRTSIVSLSHIDLRITNRSTVTGHPKCQRGSCSCSHGPQNQYWCCGSLSGRPETHCNLEDDKCVSNMRKWDDVVNGLVTREVLVSPLREMQTKAISAICTKRTFELFP